MLNVGKICHTRILWSYGLRKAWLVSLSVGLVGHLVGTPIEFDSQMHEDLSGPKTLANSQEMAQWKTCMVYVHAHLYRISCRETNW